MPSRDELAGFVAWCGKHITGDAKGQTQIFLDRLFQAFDQPGSLDAGGAAEFRIRKADEDGGGTAFAIANSIGGDGSSAGENSSASPVISTGSTIFSAPLRLRSNEALARNCMVPAMR